MSGRYLLDTNVVIAFLEDDNDVRRRFEAASQIYVPTIVLGELYFGAAHSSRPNANAKRVDDFAAATKAVAIDSETARQYGGLKAALRQRGQPIPENDLWIAACARRHDLVLVSRDRHFHRIDEISLESW